MSKIIPPEFILVPYELIEDERVTPIEERLYGIIYWFTQLKREKCTASNPVLAELVKTTTGVIRNSLIKLEQAGYIKRNFKDKNKKTRLDIVPLIVLTRVSPTGGTKKKVSSVGDTKVSSTNDTVSSTNDTKVSSVDAQNNNNINKSNKEDSEQGSQVNNLIELFKPLNPTGYKKWFSNKTQRESVRVLSELLKDKLEIAINTAVQAQTIKYAPTITTPLQLEEKLQALRSFVIKEKQKSKWEII